MSELLLEDQVSLNYLNCKSMSTYKIKEFLITVQVWSRVMVDWISILLLFKELQMEQKLIIFQKKEKMLVFTTHITDNQNFF